MDNTPIAVVVVSSCIEPAALEFTAADPPCPWTFVACCHLAFLHFVYVLPNYFHTIVVRC